MKLEHILRKIETDRRNLRHDRLPLWVIADPLWHTDALESDHIIKADTNEYTITNFPITGLPQTPLPASLPMILAGFAVMAHRRARS